VPRTFIALGSLFLVLGYLVGRSSFVAWVLVLLFVAVAASILLLRYSGVIALSATIIVLIMQGATVLILVLPPEYLWQRHAFFTGVIHALGLVNFVFWVVVPFVAALQQRARVVVLGSLMIGVLIARTLATLTGLTALKGAGLLGELCGLALGSIFIMVLRRKAPTLPIGAL
jgi:hypothetical protein